MLHTAGCIIILLNIDNNNFIMSTVSNCDVDFLFYVLSISRYRVRQNGVTKYVTQLGQESLYGISNEYLYRLYCEYVVENALPFLSVVKVFGKIYMYIVSLLNLQLYKLSVTYFHFILIICLNNMCMHNSSFF